MKFYFQQIGLSLATMALTSFTPVQAQPAFNVSGAGLTIVQTQPHSRQGTAKGTTPAGSYVQPRRGQGTPKGTTPAGSRGCLRVENKPLTALMPVTKEADGTELRWGLTTKEHPTFWFYVPYESKSIDSAKFSLRDREGQTLYETSVTLTGTPGVISVSLPANAPPLENNKWYHMYFFINNISCAPNQPLEKDFADAWVKRETLTPALNSELDKATTLQKAILYAKSGIWSEVLTTVAELRRTNPRDAEWTKLLQFVGLEAIANEPIVNCCTPSTNSL